MISFVSHTSVSPKGAIKRIEPRTERREQRPQNAFFPISTMRLPLLLSLILLLCASHVLVSATPSNATTSTSPFQAASFLLQQEYDRFEHEELRLAMLSGAKAVRKDLVLRDRERFLKQMKDNVPDTVPVDVQCEKVKHCDKKGVCAVVCKPGSVVTDLWAAQTLRLQRKVAYQRNFCNAQLPGSHNSAINIADVRTLCGDD